MEKTYTNVDKYKICSNVIFYSNVIYDFFVYVIKFLIFIADLF